MFVLRYYAEVERGYLGEARDILKKYAEKHPYATRIYSPIAGDLDTLTFDVDFEDMNQFEDFLTWLGSDETQGGLGRWYEIVDSVETELFRLVD